MMNRRQFCRKALLIAGGIALPLGALELFDPRRLQAEKGATGDVRWVFLVDTRTCVGCGFCVKACKIENEVPYDAKVSRTWVERYVIPKKGKTLIDSPNAARDGFTSKQSDQNHHGMTDIKDEVCRSAR
jgi:tetrathionate reductase subunit B